MNFDMKPAEIIVYVTKPQDNCTQAIVKPRLIVQQSLQTEWLYFEKAPTQGTVEFIQCKWFSLASFNYTHCLLCF